MFKLFTKNLDTMEKATKSNLEALNDLNRLNKDDMNKFLGGKDNEKIKKPGKFWGIFGPSPCRGDLPQ